MAMTPNKEIIVHPYNLTDPGSGVTGLRLLDNLMSTFQTSHSVPLGQQEELLQILRTQLSFTGKLGRGRESQRAQQSKM